MPRPRVEGESWFAPLRSGGSSTLRFKGPILSRRAVSGISDIMSDEPMRQLRRGFEEMDHTGLLPEFSSRRF